MGYVLPGVKPHVKKAADLIGQRYQPSSILGIGFRPNASDHPKGLALDFMIGNDLAKGDGIAAFAQANASALGITYIIWKQRIWSTGKASQGWKQMEDRGSKTANHFDHVHISFAANPSGLSNVADIAPGPIDPARPEDLPPGIGGGIPDALAGIRESLQAVGKAGEWLSNTRNWLRVGQFILGGLLILLALILLAGRGGKITKSITRGVVNRAKP